MTRNPLYRSLGGPQDRSGRDGKISPPPGFDHQTVQPLASKIYSCVYQKSVGNVTELRQSLSRHVKPNRNMKNSQLTHHTASDCHSVNTQYSAGPTVYLLYAPEVIMEECSGAGGV